MMKKGASRTRPTHRLLFKTDDQRALDFYPALCRGAYFTRTTAAEPHVSDLTRPSIGSYRSRRPAALPADPLPLAPSTRDRPVASTLCPSPPTYEDRHREPPP